MNRFPSLLLYQILKLLSIIKTDISKVGLGFSISNFFINKTAQGRKSVHEKKILKVEKIAWIRTKVGN